MAYKATTVASELTGIPSELSIIPSELTGIPSELSIIPSELTGIPSELTAVASELDCRSSLQDFRFGAERVPQKDEH
jgi:uncharacterized membrane-anchored protein